MYENVCSPALGLRGPTVSEVMWYAQRIHEWLIMAPFGLPVVPEV